MAGGRPTKYSQELVDKAKSYLINFKSLGDMMPSVAGLACELDIGRNTLYDWASQENNEFSNILARCNVLQERELLNNGLDGTFNPAITKLALGKHGYSDKQDVKAAVKEMTQEEWLDELE